MKRTILTAGVTLLACQSVNAQAVLGTFSNDSLDIYTNNIRRMYITKDGRIGMNGAVMFAPQVAARVGIYTNNTNDAGKFGLNLSDNMNYGASSNTYSQLLITNSTKEWGIWLNNTVPNSMVPAEPRAGGIMVTGDGVGYTRLVRKGKTIGYISSGSPIDSGGNFIHFMATGAFNSSTNTIGSVIDFYSQDWLYTDNPTGSRFGLYMDHQKKSGMTAAWGVYQTHATTNNYFNGAVLVGSNTNNNLDKVQVTGGTKTDGLATNIVLTTSTSYLASNTDFTILMQNPGIVTLPVYNVAVGKIYCIKNLSATPNTVGIQDADGNDIDGISRQDISTLYGTMILQFDGSNYHIISKF